jgi:hypothetical protein
VSDQLFDMARIRRIRQDIRKVLPIEYERHGIVSQETLSAAFATAAEVWAVRLDMSLRDKPGAPTLVTLMEEITADFHVLMQKYATKYLEDAKVITAFMPHKKEGGDAGKGTP